jgi:hypothetical protein
MTDQIDLQTKSDVPPPTSVGDVQSLEKDDFFQDYEGRFENDFRREFRDATGMAADDEAIALDPRALYRALFLPKDGSAADAVRASFKRLAEATEDAEVILKRTWMIMATNYISHRMKHGGRPGEVDCLQEMIQGYSKLLNDVYLDMSQSVALEIPEIDRNPDSYRQIVDDFRRYMLEDCPGDVKKELRVFTCYRGIPIESPAEVVGVDDLSVTFRVSPTQIAILGRSGLARVESPVNDIAFRAYSSDIDVSTGEVMFSHFIRHDAPVERRRYQRFQPERPVETTVHKGRNEYTGWLHDVLAVAASVFLRNVDLSPLNEGDPVELDVTLPAISSAGEIQIKIPGQLGSIHSNVDGDPNAYRVLVVMPANVKLYNRISRYITKRQARELKTLATAEAEG